MLAGVSIVVVVDADRPERAIFDIGHGLDVILWRPCSGADYCSSVPV